MPRRNVSVVGILFYLLSSETLFEFLVTGPQCAISTLLSVFSSQGEKYFILKWLKYISCIVSGSKRGNPTKNESLSVQCKLEKCKASYAESRQVYAVLLVPGEDSMVKYFSFFFCGGGGDGQILRITQLQQWTF